MVNRSVYHQLSKTAISYLSFLEDISKQSAFLLFKLIPNNTRFHLFRNANNVSVSMLTLISLGILSSHL